MNGTSCACLGPYFLAVTGHCQRQRQIIQTSAAPSSRFGTRLSAWWRQNAVSPASVSLIGVAYSNRRHSDRRLFRFIRGGSVKLDATFTTPDQSHAMMEPHASIAAWEGDKLTLWTSNHSQGECAAHLRLYRRWLRGNLCLRSDALLAALSRAARRPAKVALTRPLMFNNTTHRPATIQRICIGATRDRVAITG
jgi:hypothetical protein